MSRKKKALIVGGDERNILPEVQDVLDIVHVKNKKKKSMTFSPTICPAADMVIVMPRFMSRQSYNKAKELAKGRGIPFVEAKTGNYIYMELEKKKLAPKLQKDPSSRRAGKKKPRPVKAMEEKKVEKPKERKFQKVRPLTPEETWEVYRKDMVSFVKETMSPGEKVTESDLLDAMSVIGAPRECLRDALPELSIRGILINPKEGMWKVPTGDYEKDWEVEPEEEEKTVERKKQKSEKKPFPTFRGKITGAYAIQGLPPGPYESKIAILREMSHYDVFRRMDGKSPVDTSLYSFVSRAEKLGFITKRDGKYYVTPKETVQIGRNDRPFQIRDSRGASKEKQLSSDLRKTKGTARKEEKKEEEDGRQKEVAMKDLHLLRDGIGKIDPPDIPHDILLRVRILISKMQWKEMAQVSLKRRAKRSGIVPPSLDDFTEGEVDALAWEAVRSVPMGALAPHFRAVFEDRLMECSECHDEFILSASFQEQLFDRFGEVTPPKVCRVCKRKEVI